MQLLTAQQHISRPEGVNVVELANDADPRELTLEGVQRIDLHFPSFTDGRAHSQAHLLRRRLGFAGEIRATGDVLVDQIPLLARNGFSHAVLRGDQDPVAAQRELARFAQYYQGDAVQRRPRFAGASR
jgi:uncharacterized protein (DUF934 family)